MGTALDTVDRLYATTFERPDPEGIEPLVDTAIVFHGPLQETHGADAYIQINRQLLPFQVETRMKAQFEHDNQVCSIYELDLRTPAGAILTVPMTDWITVRNGRVAHQTVYYDPRPFLEAFPA